MCIFEEKEASRYDGDDDDCTSTLLYASRRNEFLSNRSTFQEALPVLEQKR